MPTTILRLVLAVFGVIGAVDASSQPDAQRPLRIVVGAAPGSPSDERLRALLPVMTNILARTILVDNRGFEDGMRAAQAVAQSEPNANTLLLGDSRALVAHPAITPRPGYDPIRDFSVVTQVSTTGLVLVGGAQLPAKSLDELLGHALRAGRRLTFGSESSIERVAGAALGRHLKIALDDVPQTSSITHMQALRNGQVDLTFLAPYLARPHVHGGRLKAFAITGSDRSPSLPEVATLIEQGIEGYDLPTWDGVFAPAGTPEKSLESVQRAIRQALETPSVRDRFRELGVTPVGNSRDAFAAVVKRDVATFRRLAATRDDASR